VAAVMLASFRSSRSSRSSGSRPDSVVSLIRPTLTDAYEPGSKRLSGVRSSTRAQPRLT
jgi:hypothetical protein